MSYKLHIYYATRGKDGRINEDNLLIDKYVPGCSKLPFFSGYMQMDSAERRFFAISDGAGGGFNGHEAAKITIDTFFNDLDDIKSDDVQSALTTALDRANDNVAAYYQEVDELGAATFSGLLFDEDCVWAVNLGDSPIYTVNYHKIDKISQDHTLASLQGYNGNPVASNTLVRFMGSTAMSGSDQASSSIVPLRFPATFVIASDGVQKGLDEKRLLKLISGNETDLAEKVVNTAYRRGSRDDITVIIIKIYSDTQKTEGE